MSLIKILVFIRKTQHANPRSFSIFIYFLACIGAFLVLLISNLFFGIFFPLNFLLIPKDILFSSAFLNTIITAQTTVFIFVFSLSIVVVQLSSSNYPSRYTQILKNYVDFWIIIAIFIFSIFYNLFLVFNLSFTSDPPNSLFVLSQYLFILAFISLIPYFLNILYLLRPENQLNILHREIIRKNLKGDYWTVDNHLIAIFDIIIGSFHKNDLWTVRNGLYRIDEIIDYVDLPMGRFSTYEIFQLSMNQILKEIKFFGKNSDVENIIKILNLKSKRIKDLKNLRDSLLTKDFDLESLLESIESSYNFWNIKSMTTRSIIFDMIQITYDKTRCESDNVKNKQLEISVEFQGLLTLLTNFERLFKNFRNNISISNITNIENDLIKFENYYRIIALKDDISKAFLKREFDNMELIAREANQFFIVSQIQNLKLRFCHICWM